MAFEVFRDPYKHCQTTEKFKQQQKFEKSDDRQ